MGKIIHEVVFLIIKDIKAWEILDSRGNPTIEAEITSSCGSKARASVPSGASTGVHEAVELRDDDSTRYGGKGVLQAVCNIEGEIREALLGKNCLNQKEIDNLLINLDGTENKSRLGANAILAVSIANARLGAACTKIPFFRYLGGINSYMMPLPMMNILNGGAHADNNIDIQEFMIMPVSAKSFQVGLKMCSEVYHTLKKVLSAQGLSTGVGDEGGFAPSLEGEEDAIELIMRAVEKAGYKLYDDFKIALDVASSEWYENGMYRMPKKGTVMSGEEICTYYEHLADCYPIISIEDGAAEDDMETWDLLSKRLSKKLQLVGDDLFVTNTKRLKNGIDKKIANSILIKPNQIGTVTETLDAIHLAKENGYGTVISHRSGETEDTFIADLAVGTNAGQIKTGAPCRSERNAKYNRLLKIESEI